MPMITAADVTASLNANGAANRFDPTKLAAGVMDSVLKQADAEIRANLPEKYRRMASVIPGLLLTDDAVAGQATFTVPTVARAVTSVRVWVNPIGVWADRKIADTVTATVTSNVITLATALETGDIAIAEIAHDFTNPPELLKGYAVEIAVAQLVFRLPTLQLDPSVRQIYGDRLVMVREDLDRLSRGRLRIDEWDSLAIIPENETVTPEGTGTVVLGW